MPRFLWAGSMNWPRWTLFLSGCGMAGRPRCSSAVGPGGARRGWAAGGRGGGRLRGPRGCGGGAGWGCGRGGRGVLRELVHDLGADGVAALLPGRSTRELARLLPELGEPGTHTDPDEARARMFEQALALFEQLAESGPLVLVIEDTHWSDQSTRD